MTMELLTDPKRLLDDILYIVKKEVGRFKDKAKGNEPLTLQESLMLRNYAMTTIKIEQEKRSKDYFDKITAMTDDELKAAAVSIIAADPALKKLVLEAHHKPINNTDDSEVYVE